MTKAVEKILTKFKVRFKKYPKLVQFDDGKEFYNVGVKNLLKISYDIKYFSTYSNKKAAIVERFNKTLKTSMWKYFDSKKDTHQWLNVLDDLVKNYNNTKHKSIGMKPADVNETNKHQVWIKLFGQPVGEITSSKFKIGDLVRISKYKNIFKKGYEANFTKEIFKIVEVFFGDPIVYEVEALDGEKIIGKFYEEELSAVENKYK